MVRAKFQCTEKVEYQGDSRKLVFEARYDEKIAKEDKAFSNATPSGKFEMMCTNPKANEYFKVGKYYYFDVTEVE